MGERSELTRENFDKSKEGGVFGFGFCRNFEITKPGMVGGVLTPWCPWVFFSEWVSMRDRLGNRSGLKVFRNPKGRGGIWGSSFLGAGF